MKFPLRFYCIWQNPATQSGNSAPAQFRKRLGERCQEVLINYSSINETLISFDSARGQHQTNKRRERKRKSSSSMLKTAHTSRDKEDHSRKHSHIVCNIRCHYSLTISAVLTIPYAVLLFACN